MVMFTSWIRHLFFFFFFFFFLCQNRLAGTVWMYILVLVLDHSTYTGAHIQVSPSTCEYNVYTDKKITYPVILICLNCIIPFDSLSQIVKPISFF